MHNRWHVIHDLSDHNKLRLAANVWLHFTQFLLACFILFILPPSFDILVIILLMILLPMKYIISQRKCILTEQEKQIMDHRFTAKYPGSEPYLQYLNANKLVAFVKLVVFYPLTLFTIYVIVTRYMYSICPSISVALFVATSIVLVNAYVHSHFAIVYWNILRM